MLFLVQSGHANLGCTKPKLKLFYFQDVHLLSDCLCAKSCSLICWPIIEHGSSKHFRIVNPDPVYTSFGYSKTQAFQENGKDTIIRGSLTVNCVQKIVGEFLETFRKNQKR